MADGIYWLTESRIDGKPIVLVLRGAAGAQRARRGRKLQNGRHGSKLRACAFHIEPQEAARIGEDYSVCGDACTARTS